MELIGANPLMAALRRRVEQVGPTEATVLIRGERGVGKELVATAIHRASRRRARPFVAINCAALPVELLASELFGHERGAFTGATQRSRGLLAAADGGTVFLDEIGDLSLAGQAMLLRFLQEREVRPLGSAGAARIDVRVLAATNADLGAAMRERTFRTDLYNRLNEVALEVPALRDRREDLPRLVDHLIRRFARRHGRPKPRLRPEAARVIAGYAWPGNVRELEHALSRAVIFAAGGWIRAEDLRLPDDLDLSAAAGSVPDSLSLRQLDIVRLATAHGRIRRADVMHLYGVSGETARRELRALVGLGLLCRDGIHRGARYAPARCA